MSTDYTAEPMIIVEGFGEVYAATVDTVTTLLDSGHDVELTADGRLTITPEVRPDLYDHLSSSPSEIRAAIVHHGCVLFRDELRQCLSRAFSSSSVQRPGPMSLRKGCRGGFADSSSPPTL